MTGTRTHTTTRTKTKQEAAVLAAIEVRQWGRPARWPIEKIQEFIHSNSKTSDLVDVPDWLSPVIIGQLIERGLVVREGTDPERYSRA